MAIIPDIMAFLVALVLSSIWLFVFVGGFVLLVWGVTHESPRKVWLGGAALASMVLIAVLVIVGITMLLLYPFPAPPASDFVKLPPGAQVVSVVPGD